VRVAIRLKARGWDVLVVSLMSPQAYVDKLEAAGVPVFSLDIHRRIPDPRPILQLARLIRESRLHIVHSHMVHANLLARIVRPLAPVPVLICTAYRILRKAATCASFSTVSPIPFVTLPPKLAGLEWSDTSECVQRL
jgi:ribulose-5-phosphate 4-epimerase/fuculose-1-phosphate aldolase